jgi:Zn-dependent oligopeptidase
MSFKLETDAENIAEKMDDILQRAKQVDDNIAMIPDEEVTFENVVAPLAHKDCWLYGETSPLTFAQHVSTDKNVRDASVQATKTLDSYNIESGMRIDIYDKVKLVKDYALEFESKRLLQFLLRGYKRNGLHLSSDERERLSSLQKELFSVSANFTNNLTNDKTTLSFSKEELTGVPEGFLEQRSRDEEEKFIVTLRLGDMLTIMKQCTVGETRRQMTAAYDSRCLENVALLGKAVKIRDEIAHLLGYQSHAHYKLEIKMAKTPEEVSKFLNNLHQLLEPYARMELDKLKSLKGTDDFHCWDWMYYDRLLLETEHQVNEEKIKEYFEVNTLTIEMLKLYEELLSLRIVQEEDFTELHEDVKLFSVYDKEQNTFMGQFYLDLYSRENKYSHVAVFPLHLGQIDENGTRHLPICAMVANYIKGTDTRPSLLKHSDVVTYFHELGHVMHNVLSETKYSTFHGTSVERDFVEAPSQMLENWCWSKPVIQKLSKHYKTGKPLDEDVIDKLVHSRTIGKALFNMRQIFFAMYDMKIHSEKVTDLTALYNRMREKYTLLPAVTGTHGQTGFIHLLGGYDAGYYGYLWSQVLSADMFFTRFEKEGVFNKETGRSYREMILKPGGTIDGMDMVRNFLGREPNQEAFLKSLGI